MEGRIITTSSVEVHCHRWGLPLLTHFDHLLAQNMGMEQAVEGSQVVFLDGIRSIFYFYYR
jgi:hypothetical protein